MNTFLLLFYYIVFELNCIPHPFQIHVLKSYPWYLGCDLIWRQALYRGNKVKMRSLGWVLIQYDCCCCC